MNTDLLHTKELPWLSNSIILLTDSGSKAYGTNLETSDEDYKGVCIPPIEYHIGLKTFDQTLIGHDSSKRSTMGDVEITVQGIKKFFTQAMDGNPNVLEVLFTEKESIVMLTDEGQTLLDNRELFLSNRIKHSFGGFAKQQKKRLEKGLGQRQELVQLYGYDTKTLVHSIRLYQMGIEVTQTGKMRTKRPNADELKAIRKGKYTQQEGLELLNALEEDFQQALKTSVLPDKVDRNKVEKVLIDLILPKLQG